MRGKRGVGPEQIFVYVASSIIVVIILIFGYQSLNTVQDTVSQAELVQFKNTMQQLVLDNAGYGKDSFEAVAAPIGVEMVCMYGAEESFSAASACNPWLPCLSTVCGETHFADSTAFDIAFENMGGSASGRSDTNVVLYGPNFLEMFTVNGIWTGQCDIVCAPAEGGRFNLRLQGLGVGARVVYRQP